MKNTPHLADPHSAEQHSPPPLNTLYLTGIVLSVLASVVLITSDPLLNTDGVLYLRMAQAYIESGYSAAAELYPRAFYSVLIAQTHMLTEVSLVNSAHLLNTAFYALLVSGFVCLVRELGGNNRTLWIALATILLLPHLNEYRHYVIRDAGYWALSIWSIIAFFRYYKSHQLSALLTWLTLAIFASFFRPEAISLFSLALCLLPQLKAKTRTRTKIKTQLPIAALLTTALIASLAGLLVAIAGKDVALQLASEPFYTVKEHTHELVSNFDLLANNFGETTLNRYSDDHAHPALFIALEYILFAHLFDAIGWPLILLLIATVVSHRKQKFQWENTAPIFLLILVNVFILNITVIDRQFLQSRHCALLVLNLALFIPFLIERLIANGSLVKNKLRLSGATLFVLYLFLDSFVSFGHSKNHIFEAAQWLQKETPKNSVIYTNSTQLAWLAKREIDWKAIEYIKRETHYTLDNTQHYLALVIKHGKTHPLLLQQANSTPVKILSNKQKDQVIIYSLITQHSKDSPANKPSAPI